MQAIIFAVLPLLVTGFTTLLKRVPVIDKTDGTTRVVIIRGLAAFLSLLGVVGAFLSTGQIPDLTILNDLILTLVLAFLTFLGSVGGHEILKKD